MCELYPFKIQNAKGQFWDKVNLRWEWCQFLASSYSKEEIFMIMFPEDSEFVVETDDEANIVKKTKIPNIRKFKNAEYYIRSKI